MTWTFKVIISSLIITAHTSWGSLPPEKVQITDLDLNEFSSKNKNLREFFASHPVFLSALVTSKTKKDGKIIIKKVNMGISNLIFDYLGDREEWVYYKTFNLQSYFDFKDKQVCFSPIATIEFDESDRLLKIILRKLPPNVFNPLNRPAEIIYWNHLTNTLTIEPDCNIQCIPFWEGQCFIHHGYLADKSRIISKNNLYMAFKRPWPDFDGSVPHDNEHLIKLFVNQTQLLRNIHACQPLAKKTD